MENNRRILILDDEPGLIAAYQGILGAPVAPKVVASSRRTGAAAAAAAPVAQAQTNTFEITCVQNGEDAVKQVETSIREGKPFVGGFFDVKLGGGIDGIETIRRVRDLDPKMFCVIVTAYQDRSIEEITRIFGAEYSDHWDFLNKPFSGPEIEQKARNLVSQWARRRQEETYLFQIKTQQEQLVRSERLAAVGTLARGIGHELGNVLLRIVGKAGLALAKKDPAEMASALEIVISATERAGVIVRNLQSLVKIETQREKANPVGPLKDSLQLISHELKVGKIKVVENLATDIPDISLNKVEMSQVFLNLLINAIHALETKGGELSLAAKKENTAIVFEIKDTGCGIPSENLSKIFEPLFTTKGARGTGIGLSVSKKIVENHGGTIEVKSEVGKGSTFTIRLPIK